MSIDVPLIAVFVYVFIKSNLFGKGLLQEGRDITFLIFAVLAYPLLDLFLFLTKKAWLKKVKILLLLAFVLFVSLGVSIDIMALRDKIHPANYINDSALQTEIAGRFLLLKKNPYVEPYTQTDLAKWTYYDSAGNTVNPALFTNVTPPLIIVLSSLGFRVFSQMFGWFDIRVFILAAYLSIIYFGLLRFGLKEKLLLFLALVCFNPLFLIETISGANDVIILALLIWCLFFLEKKKFILSGLLLGAAVASKQTAWFAVPFFALYAWQQAKRTGFKYFVIASLATALPFYLPFFLWNSSALINSLVFYVSGASQTDFLIHPIEGYGFGRLLLAWGKLKTIYDQFPFWLYQLGLGGPLMLALLYLQKKKMTAVGLIASYAICLGVIWFFNRYFLEAHLAYLLVLISLAFIWPKKEIKKRK